MLCVVRTLINCQLLNRATLSLFPSHTDTHAHIQIEPSSSLFFPFILATNKVKELHIYVRGTYNTRVYHSCKSAWRDAIENTNCCIYSTIYFNNSVSLRFGECVRCCVPLLLDSISFLCVQCHSLLLIVLTVNRIYCCCFRLLVFLHSFPIFVRSSQIHRTLCKWNAVFFGKTIGNCRNTASNTCCKSICISKMDLFALVNV